MKINFNQVLKDIDGEKAIPSDYEVGQCPNCGFKNGKVESRGNLTLKIAATRALNFNFEDERSLSGDKKAIRGLLAIRIYSNPENIDLEAGEIDEIKKLIDKLYGPLIVARARELLSIKEKEKDGK